MNWGYSSPSSKYVIYNNTVKMKRVVVIDYEKIQTSK
jgi:hypothetical protein